jgi:hypothetical protein
MWRNVKANIPVFGETRGKLTSPATKIKESSVWVAMERLELLFDEVVISTKAKLGNGPKCIPNYWLSRDCVKQLLHHATLSIPYL